MARKLPWASPAPGSTSTTGPAAKRVKKEQPSLKPKPGPRISTTIKHEDAFVPSSPRKSRTTTHPDRTGRTPSTSPPPSPPRLETLRPGLDADDKFMMVEDEFYTVAQSFTAHLHHAEYKRLMRGAKERNLNADTIIPKLGKGASIESKLRHRGDELATRQGKGIRDVTMSGALGDSDDEDMKKEEVEDDVIEPWAGTSLAGLMNWDGSHRASLRGLDGVRSGTRAARGFGPSTGMGQIQSEDSDEVSRGKTAAEDKVLNESDSRPKRAHHSVKELSKPHVRHQDLKDSSRSSSSAGSEFRPTRISEDRPPPKTTTLSASLSARKIKSETSTTSSSITSNPTKLPAKKPRVFLDDWDDDRFDSMQAAATTIPPSPPLPPPVRTKEKVRIKREIGVDGTVRKVEVNGKSGTKKKDRRDRYDEIPVWLV